MHREGCSSYLMCLCVCVFVCVCCLCVLVCVLLVFCHHVHLYPKMLVHTDYHGTETTFIILFFTKNSLFSSYNIICFLECHQLHLSTVAEGCHATSRFRFPFSTFRLPFSTFRLPFSIFHFPTSIFQFPTSKVDGIYRLGI